MLCKFPNIQKPHPPPFRNPFLVRSSPTVQFQSLSFSSCLIIWLSTCIIEPVVRGQIWIFYSHKSHLSLFYLIFSYHMATWIVTWGTLGPCSKHVLAAQLKIGLVWHAHTCFAAIMRNHTIMCLLVVLNELWDFWTNIRSNIKTSPKLNFIILLPPWHIVHDIKDFLPAAGLTWL